MKRLFAVACVVVFALAMAMPVGAAYTENPYTAAGESAGVWVNSNRGHTIRILESGMTHPSAADNLVNKGDPVYVGSNGIVGVALESASAATDYINVALDGIVFLNVHPITGNLSIGDEVFLDKTSALLSDDPDNGVKIGHVMTATTSGSNAVRAVMLTGANAQSMIGENSDYIHNTTDGAIEFMFDDDAVELGDIQISSTNTSTSDNDYLRLSWYVEDSSSGKTEMARLDMVATDVTTATEDADLRWSVIAAGTMAEEMRLNGAALRPTTEGGLTLGATGFGWGNTHINGNIACTGTLTVTGATALGGGDSMVAVFSGSNSIANGANPATDTVTISGLDSDDCVIVFANEDLGTGTIYAKVETGEFDVALWDVLSGVAHAGAASEQFDYSYIAILD